MEEAMWNVTGRMKDFDIMKAELPLEMFDLFDHLATVAAALVNLRPQQYH